ncbi:hypothetical protein H0266_14255 [Halobacillus locisalis]|uniref:Uncharacterized protein n=1 Tax=Halobacillus locisalis TaxID=220753 RepID=A0A838CWA5_9BACI|nr:hypothetical protein [Halobacillus locisalis]MBA2176055.1 hypothetical protein [Halobacillus locisalis]
MDINTDALVSFIILWGTPSVMCTVAYLKMSKDEKRDVIEDFTTRRFILTIGFLTIGGFLASLGNLLSVNAIKFVGLALLIISGITSVVTMWRDKKAKSLLIVMLIGVAIYVWI